MNPNRYFLLFILLGAAGLAVFGFLKINERTETTKLQGALIDVSMKSKTGVLLDEIPKSLKEKTIQLLMNKPESFWQNRAKAQVRLTSLRLVFRNEYYDENEGRHQLPLPPEAIWQIGLLGKPQRETIAGHDLVTVNYRFSSTLLTDEESPGKSEPNLKNIGGEWKEPFIFPVDPEFVFQRTEFACLDEDQFPPNSVDPEEVDTFYDQECEVEEKLSNHGGCHQTKMPALSCLQALDAKIGKIETEAHFTRIAWDPKRADQVRIQVLTNTDGSDITPVKEEFQTYRFNYRYIPQNSCTITEKCVGGPGWRRILQFTTSDINVGNETLDIGPVDYFLDKNGSTLSEHGIFEFSQCHQHYHFAHYGSFTLGGSANINRKNGFCLQSTSRLHNNESSPLTHPYQRCDFQGMAVGWADQYKTGLECQWVDVTGIKPEETLPLTFTTNPDGFLCEGKPKLDKDGHPLFKNTPLKTADEKNVERPQCDLYSKWFDNNVETYSITIPEEGDSYVTSKCREGLFGPLRNCGLKKTQVVANCEPGKPVSVTCKKQAGAGAQVVRFCDYSKALKTGIPCTYNNSLASKVIESNEQKITFTCPAALDDVETGGAYSLYTGAFFLEDAPAEVNCS